MKRRNFVKGALLASIKPTVGLVSRAGIIPIAHSQDTAGPATRARRPPRFLRTVEIV